MFSNTKKQQNNKNEEKTFQSHYKVVYIKI